MQIIGISGKKQSGKDTVASYIEKIINPRPYIRRAYADSLKDEVCEACGITREFLEQNKNNFRLILQGWGTDFRRKLYSDDYWILKTFNWINNTSRLASPDTLFVIPDVRFINEASFIKEIGGSVIRIIRRLDIHKNDTHQSEIELDNYNEFDGVILNEHGTNELFQMTQQMLKQILKHDRYIHS